MTDQFARLAEAARTAQTILLRVGAEGGIAESIERGYWNRNLSREQATDLADLLFAMSERVRYTRSVAGSMTSDSHHPPAYGISEWVSSEGLPLNRKERFYTGTVLPMIVASDGFAHLHRFLALCGLQIEPRVHGALEGDADIEFITEYNFAESRFTDQDRARFADAPSNADTPDLVVVGPGWLLAVEAKMFHDPSPSALNEQMHRQRVLVDYWARCLRVPEDRVAHVLLLPSGLPTNGVSEKAVTWESVLEQYQVVGPAYWTRILRTALDRYDTLRSRGIAFGANADSRMTGAEIVQAHGLGELDYTYMGRHLGLGGSDLANDLSSGSWRTRLYEVRYEPLVSNPNWFAIQDFIGRTAL